MRYALALLVTGLLCGCKVIDPAEEIPSYISIPSVSFSNPGGSATHKITDAWIYVDGELIGGFEIPCKVPVLKEGTHSVWILPGVKQSGNSGLRAIYPYYKGWESQIELVRGQLAVITPVFTYFPGTVFRWNCNFDGLGNNFDDDGHAVFPGLLTLDSGPEALEGNSARITLTASENYFYGTSTDSFLIDQAHEIYLEMDYKCDQEFIVGLRDCSPNQGGNAEWVYVQPHTTWNKMYIRLNDALSGMPADHYYSVSFKMTLPASAPTGTLWLDNLKLMY